MTPRTWSPVEVFKTMIVEDGRWLRGRTAEPPPRTLPPGAPAPPASVLEPVEASAGRAIPPWRLTAGRLLGLVGYLVGTPSLVVFVGGIVVAVFNADGNLFDRVEQGVNLWAYLGILLGAGFHYAADRVMERSLRRDALERATKEHEAALAGYFREVHEAGARMEMEAVYRTRLPRMEDAAAALARARADLTVVRTN
jgi:hypothetical protein